jgi:predicted metal-binding membrane protein
MEGRAPMAAHPANARLNGRGPALQRVGGQAALAGALLTIAAAAWVATDLRMAGMDGGPGTNPGAFGFYISTWIVMMAAMMLPSITPMVLTYRGLQHERREPGRSAKAGETGLFAAGYLAVWAAAGLLGYVLLEAGRSLDGGFFGWDRAGRWAAAGVLAAAALYQLTPTKSACLTRCRGRRAFIQSGWRDGRDGALRMGMKHGAWCIGCCWGLMAALFALGAMSVGWMVVVCALISAERLLPWRAPIAAGVAAVIAAIAIGVAAVPARVPLLTIPGSPAAMRAMGASPHRQMEMAQPAPQGTTGLQGRPPRCRMSGSC